MKHKLLYTPGIGYDMSDWDNEPIEKVFAGTDCILAITTDGRVLQKTKKPEVALRTQYWARIKDISLSGWAPCHAIGLVSNGTCMVAKRELRALCDLKNHVDTLWFDEVNNEIKSWSNIIQVAVSDSYFALDSDGKVHVASHSRFNRDEYAIVPYWDDICRISTGLQNSILGVTKSGEVLGAGANILNGSHGNARECLSKFHDVADVCVTGSECGKIILALKDGTITDLDGHIYPVTASVESLPEGKSIFKSHFYNNVLLVDSNNHLVSISGWEVSQLFDGNPTVSSFAIGDVNYLNPFVLAVACENDRI